MLQEEASSKVFISLRGNSSAALNYLTILASLLTNVPLDTECMKGSTDSVNKMECVIFLFLLFVLGRQHIYSS